MGTQVLPPQGGSSQIAQSANAQEKNHWSAQDLAERARYLERMRIATWNVNSLKQRLPRLLPWLDQRQPDVLCLQETKLADDAFAQLLGDELADRGYEVAAHGEATWNGV